MLSQYYASHLGQPHYAAYVKGTHTQTQMQTEDERIFSGNLIEIQSHQLFTSSFPLIISSVPHSLSFSFHFANIHFLLRDPLRLILSPTYCFFN